MKHSGKYTLSLFFVLTGIICYGQQFTFRYTREELVDVQHEIDIKPHFLGEGIAVKMQLLRESYTYRQRNKITLQERNVVEKPSIYYSVKKMNNYLKKEIRRGNLSRKEANEQLNNALNIALNIRYQETEKLEELLWKIKDPDKIAIFYSQNVKLEKN